MGTPEHKFGILANRVRISRISKVTEHTMHLSRIIIRNYRSIENVDLKIVKGKTVLVGKNNAWKSNVVKAIDLVLWSSSPTWWKSENIQDSDFHWWDTSKTIFISCDLERSITDEVWEPLDFSGLLGGWSIPFISSEKNGEPKEFSFSDELNQNEEVELLKEICIWEWENKSKYEKSWINRKDSVANLNRRLGSLEKLRLLFICENVDGERKKGMVWIWKDADCDYWHILPNPNDLRNAFLESAIIPAFRDPKEQLRITDWTWYGKLMKRSISPDPELLNALAEVKSHSDRLFASMREWIENSGIEVAFPGTRISFQVTPEKYDLHKQSTIYVDDGHLSRLQDKWSWIQSSVIIGLFDYYLTHFAHKGGSLLALEEPELYLHPQARRALSSRLSTFAALDGNRQVILTTHSSEFVTCSWENLNVVLVAKRGGKTVARSLPLSHTTERRVLIKPQNAEMYFADAVILMEGADKYLLEAVARNMSSKYTTPEWEALESDWLNRSNVSVISCWWKNEIKTYKWILKRLGIPCLVVADFDFFQRGLKEYLVQCWANAEITTAHETLLKEIMEKIKENMKSKDVTLMLETVHEHLKLNWPIVDTNEWKTRLEKKLQWVPNIKRLSDVPTDFQERTKAFQEALKDDWLWILDCELEDFYSPKLTWLPSGKENKVLEIVSRTLLQKDAQNLDDLILGNDFEKILCEFSKKILGKELLPIVECPENAEALNPIDWESPSVECPTTPDQ